MDEDEIDRLLLGQRAAAPTSAADETPIVIESAPYRITEHKPLLPSLTADCLHNSTRSPIMMFLTAAFIAMAVTTLFLVTLNDIELNFYEAEFLTAPSLKAEFGQKLPAFSVRVTQGERRDPAVGVQLTVTLKPIQPLQLKLVLPTPPVINYAQVDCVASEVGTTPQRQAFLRQFCGEEMVGKEQQSSDGLPYRAYSVLGSTAVTGTDGTAQFGGVVMTNGFAAQYLLSVHLQSSQVRLSRVVTVYAPTVAMQLSPGSKVTQTQSNGLEVEIDVTATWRARKPFRDATLSALAGVPLRPAVQRAAATILTKNLPEMPDYDTLQMSLVTLNPFESSSQTTFFGCNSASVGQFLAVVDTRPSANNGGKANLTRSDLQFDATASQVTARVTLKGNIIGSNTDNIFFGVYFLGQVLAVPKPPFIDEGARVLLPYSYSTDVTQVKITSFSSPMTVEASREFSVDISITRTGTTSSSDVPKYLFLELRPGLAPPTLGSRALETPIWKPKVIATPATPHAVLTNGMQQITVNVSLTGFGNVGRYDLYAICDGVWSSSPVVLDVVPTVSASNSIVTLHDYSWSDEDYNDGDLPLHPAGTVIKLKEGVEEFSYVIRAKLLSVDGRPLPARAVTLRTPHDEVLLKATYKTDSSDLAGQFVIEMIQATYSARSPVTTTSLLVVCEGVTIGQFPLQVTRAPVDAEHSYSGYSSSYYKNYIFSQRCIVNITQFPQQLYSASLPRLGEFSATVFNSSGDGDSVAVDSSLVEGLKLADQTPGSSSSYSMTSFYFDPTNGSSNGTVLVGGAPFPDVLRPTMKVFSVTCQQRYQFGVYRSGITQETWLTVALVPTMTSLSIDIQTLRRYELPHWWTPGKTIDTLSVNASIVGANWSQRVLDNQMSIQSLANEKLGSGGSLFWQTMQRPPDNTYNFTVTAPSSSGNLCLYPSLNTFQAPPWNSLVCINFTASSKQSISSIEIVRNFNFSFPDSFTVGQAPLLRASDSSGSSVFTSRIVPELVINGTIVVTGLERLEDGAIGYSSSIPCQSSMTTPQGMCEITDLLIYGVKQGSRFFLRYRSIDDPDIYADENVTYFANTTIRTSASLDSDTVTVGDSLRMDLISTVPINARMCSWNPCYNTPETAIQVLLWSANLAPVIIFSGKLYNSQYPQDDHEVHERWFTVYGVTLPSSTVVPAGSYSLAVRVPGGISPPMLVKVSDEPTEITVSPEPPAELVIDQEIVLKAFVSRNFKRLAGFDVQVSLVPLFPCTGVQCGVLTGTVSGVTQEGSGVTFDPIKITAGLDGFYQFHVSMSAQGAETILASMKATLLLDKAKITGNADAIGKAIEAASKSSAASTASNNIQSVFGGKNLEYRSLIFHLKNRVHRVEIVTQPLLVGVVGQPATFTAKQQPQVKVTDANGKPLVEYPVFAVSSAVDIAFDSSTLQALTNNAGIASFNLSLVRASFKGSFSLQFHSRGVTSNISDEGFGVDISNVKGQTTSERMQIASYALIFVLLPVLIMNVPYSSAWWIPVSVTILIGLGVFFWFEVDELLESPTTSFLISFGVLAFLWVTLLVKVVLIFVLRMMSCAFPWQKPPPGFTVTRPLEDEARIAHEYAYTKWLLNLRRNQHATELEHKRQANMKRLSSVTHKMYEKIRGLGSAFSKIEGVRFVSISERVSKELMPPLLPPPSCHITAAFVPLKFDIMISIVFILYILLVILSIYLCERVVKFNDKLISMLPHRGDVSKISGVPTDWVPESKETISLLMQHITSVLPQYNYLNLFIGPLVSSSLFDVMSVLSSYLTEFRAAVPTARLLAHVVSGVVLLGAILRMRRRVPSLVVAARRGEFNAIRGALSVDLANKFIGTQSVIFVAQHQFIFWIVFFVIDILLSGLVRSFLWEHLKLIFSVTLIVSVIAFLVRKFFIKIFIANQFTVRQNLVFSLWSVIAAAMGVFSGFLVTILRILKFFGFFIGCFPRTDHGLFPWAFRLQDKGYVMFYSVIVAEAQYNNPVALTFAALVLVEARLREANNSGGVASARRKRGFSLVEGDGGTSSTSPTSEATSSSGSKACWITRESLSGEDESLLPNLANMVRQIVGDKIKRSNATGGPKKVTHANPKFSDGCLLSDLVTKNSRTNLVASRWWLLYLLSKNPSLQHHRKHVLAKEKELILGGAPIVCDEFPSAHVNVTGEDESELEMRHTQRRAFTLQPQARLHPMEVSGSGRVHPALSLSAAAEVKDTLGASEVAENSPQLSAKPDPGGQQNSNSSGNSTDSTLQIDVAPAAAPPAANNKELVKSGKIDFDEL